MGSTVFRIPRALSSALALLGTLQPRALGFQNTVDPLDTVSNCYIETQGEIETPHCTNISLVLRHLATILYIIQSVNTFLKVGFADQQVILPRVKMSYSVPQDPLFQRQWYLVSKIFLPVLHL